MTRYTIHTPETATGAAKDMLAGLGRMIGFAPNVFAVMGANPPVLAGFVEVTKRFGQTSLSATEREIVHIAASVENGCAYCVAGHTAFAKMQNVPADVIEAVRERGIIADLKLAALHDFVRTVVINRGHVSPAELDRFLAAGYTRGQVLEVILGICEKIFSNFTSVMLDIPLDDAFTPHAWVPKTARRAA